MKAAVSIPDPIFDEAEAYAERMRLPRSQVYAQALKEFLARRRENEFTRSANLLADLMDEEDQAWLMAGAQTAARYTDWPTG